MVSLSKVVPLNQTTLLNLPRANPNSHRLVPSKLRLLQTHSRSSCLKHHNRGPSLDTQDLKDSLNMVCRASQANTPASPASQ
jgi:hypothetical protein